MSSFDAFPSFDDKLTSAPFRTLALISSIVGGTIGTIVSKKIIQKKKEKNDEKKPKINLEIK